MQWVLLPAFVFLEHWLQKRKNLINYWNVEKVSPYLFLLSFLLSIPLLILKNKKK